LSTLVEVARLAGVSLATASRVISNSSYGVTKELQDRVLAAAEELDYVPNAHAQALVRSKMSALGVIVQDVSDPYFSEVVRGIHRVADETGRLVTVCNTYRDPERELAYLRLLRAQKVEAIILASSGLNYPEHSRKVAAQLGAFESSGGRVSLIGRHFVSGSTVVPANRGGALALGRELIRLGHRRFGVVSSPLRIGSTIDKLGGFRDALNEEGLDLPLENVVEGDFSRASGVGAVAELLEKVAGITAIVAFNDQMAVGVLAALRERGILVPEEISVTGFNDTPIARDLTPALTTVRLPLVEMGVRATQLALKPSGDKSSVERLPTELVLRSSTAEARSLSAAPRGNARSSGR
jgi:LacI family transcriptional regulator, galactose operon repressor